MTVSQRAREAAADLLEASGRIPPGKYRDDILSGKWDHTDEVQIIHRFEAETLERAAKVCEAQQQIFLSPEYATGQPMSSFGERFACGKCAEEIRAMLTAAQGDAE